MKRRTHRLDVRRFLPLLLLVGLACEDSPTGTARYISILEPLRMSWPGQDQGAPYDGSTAVFEARAALRVVWSFSIEGFTTDGRKPRYTLAFDNQDRIAFTWTGESTSIHDFAAGDSCVAKVTFKQMDPAQIESARVIFRIGP